MRGNFDRSLEAVLKHEGGWADHKADPGGATMRGVTLATYSAFLGRQATKAELRAIPDAHLKAIYRKSYWDEVRGDDLPSGVDYCVFDAAVNSGPKRAAMWLQGAAGAPADGAIGPQTLAIVGKADPSTLIERMCSMRMSFLRRLNTWSVFGRGWTARVSGVEALAKSMVGAAPKQETPVPTEPAGLLAWLVAAIKRLFSRST